MSVSNTDYLSRTNSERVSVGGVASLKESLHRLWPLPLPSRIPEAVRIPTAQKMAIRSPKGQNGQTRRETKTRRNGKRLFVALEIRCGQIDDLRRRQKKRGEIEAMDRLPFSRSRLLCLIFVWHRAIAIHYVDRPREGRMVQQRRNAMR